MADDVEKKDDEQAAAAPADAAAEAPAEAPAKVADPEAPVADAGLDDDLLAEGDDKSAGKVRRSKSSKNIPVGVVHIRATFNNTMVSITDTQGNLVSWSSAGRAGFKGSRKSTAYAATVVAQEAARQALSHGLREVEVRMQGPGAGRESAVRALQSTGMSITVIHDVTPIPHNGCRPPKRRRV